MTPTPRHCEREATSRPVSTPDLRREDRQVRPRREMIKRLPLYGQHPALLPLTIGLFHEDQLVYVLTRKTQQLQQPPGGHLQVQQPQDGR